MLDQRPEVRDHALAAIALRRRHDHMGAFRPGREAGHQLAVHMKERQAAEDRLAGAEAVFVEARHRPGVERFGEVGAPRDFRRAGRAAGAEIGGDVVGLRRLEGQGVAALLLQFARENRARERSSAVVSRCSEERSASPSAGGRRRAPCRRRAPRAGSVRPRRGGRRLPPEVGPGRRGERHQKLRLDRLQEPGELLRLEERTDREGDARGLAAPDRRDAFPAGSAGRRRPRRRARPRGGERDCRPG